MAHNTPSSAGNPPFTIAAPGSNVSIPNNNAYSLQVIVTGGLVSVIQVSTNNTTWQTIGLLTGIFDVPPGCWFRIAYTTPPVITAIPC